MNNVRASAPGKIILFGEHFVVRGNHAIAGSIGLRAYVSSREKRDWPLIIESRNLGMQARVYHDKGKLKVKTGHIDVFQPFIQILERLRETEKIQPAIITIDSEIPVSAGLGSSAASAAAFTASYGKLLGYNITREFLLQMSYEAEKVVHGKPSGIDNTIVVEGGVILYRREEGYRRISVNMRDGRLVIADTGVRRRTGDVVLDVLELYDRHERVFDEIYRAAEEVVKESIPALERGELEVIGELMNVNQGLLYSIGVSNERIEKLLHTARGEGALGAKLTGAGRGGSIIALAKDEDASRIKSRLLENAPWSGIGEFGVEGVKIEED
ncbi:MAG: mevalonate kinase [Desulfurococcales archaeon]|nr:mevalonate kinase [Desulfurococcales archaeon]